MPTPSSKLFDQANAELNKVWITGTVPWIVANNPTLDDQINKAFNHIETVWQLFEDKKVGLAEFREAVGQWYKLMLSGLEQYKKAIPMVTLPEIASP
jgi:hypothetical protein